MLKATKGKLNTNSNVGLQLFWKRKYKSTLFLCPNHLLWMKIWYIHYYRTRMLSQLGKPFCPGFPTWTAKAGQKGDPPPICPESGNRDKREPLVLVGNTNRDQRVCQRRRGRHLLWTKGPFFPVSFPVSFGLFLFHFRLNFVLEFK